MKISNEVKIGITVIAALFIGVVGFRIMKDVPLFSNGRQIISTFGKVDGLSSGKKIYFNGVDIGSILTVELLPNDSVRVTMTIDSATPIPDDSKAYIRSTDFLGSKAIIIEKGSSSTILRQTGVLKGVFDEGTLSILQQKGLSLGDRVAEVGENLNVVLKNANSALSDDVKSNLAASIKNLERLTRETETLISENKAKVNQSVSSLSRTLANLDTMSTENKPEIKLLIKELNEQLAKMDELTTSLTQTSKELNELFKKINNGEGTLGKLANDPSLYNQLDSLALHLQKLVRNIDKDPKKYLQHVDINLF